MNRLALVALAAVLTVAGFVVSRAGGNSYTVRAEFQDAAGLRGHSEVKVGGVEVGTVTSMAVTPQNTALVTLSLNGARIGAGAQAFVRPVNLLGEKYVDLQPGDLHHPLPSGSLIPLARTGTPVELDQLLDTLDASTRVRLEILIDASGEALAGRGHDFGATLASLPPALDHVRAMIGAFAQDNRALGRLVDQSDQVIRAMAGQRQALGSLIDTTSRALSVVASRDAELGQTIQQAAPTIVQLRTTLADLQQTSAALAPAANGLRASAPGLAATLTALPGFAAAARPTLATAASVAPTLDRLGVEASPVVIRLRPVAADLRAFAADFGPLSATFDAGIGNLLGFVEGWARAIQVGDGASHMFRNQLILSPELAQRLITGYLRPASAPAAAYRATSAGGPSPAAPSPATTLAAGPPSAPAPGAGGVVVGVPHLPVATPGKPPVPSQGVSQLLNFLLGK